MTVYVSGVGIVSSLGQNYTEHKANLYALKEGISKNRYNNHGWTLDAYTGRIFKDPEVPDYYQNETRNFKFAFSALQEALTSSGINLKDYQRIALCLGTSLGGNVAGQEALYHFLNGNR